MKNFRSAWSAFSEVLSVSVLVFLHLSFPGLSFYVFLTFFGCNFSCSMSSLPFSFTLEFFFSRSWRLHIDSVNAMNVESTLCATYLIRKLCHYACALIEKYWMYIFEIEEIYIRYERTYGRYIYTYGKSRLVSPVWGSLRLAPMMIYSIHGLASYMYIAY